MTPVKNFNRFVDCVSNERDSVALNSLTLLENFISATNGQIMYSQRVPKNSNPIGYIPISNFDKNSIIQLSKNTVNINGKDFTIVQKPFPETVITNSLKKLNSVVNIIDAKGLLKELKKISVITTKNPTNGRNSNRKLPCIYISLKNFDVYNAFDDKNAESAIANFKKFIKVDSNFRSDYDYLSFNPQYVIQILKEFKKERNNIFWEIDSDNSNSAYVFSTTKEKENFYLLMPMRQ